MATFLDDQLDLSGLMCPAVVLRLADRLQELPAKSQLTVISTDPLSRIDIPLFLRRNGHRLVREENVGETIVFVLEKAA